jgi:hypothetical protein
VNGYIVLYGGLCATDLRAVARPARAVRRAVAVAAYARSYVNVSPSACALAHKRYTHITAAAAAPARFLAQLPTYQARCQS